MLPELSGYEILERVRNDANSAMTPFIFLTALADRSDMRQGMNLGADDYLTKPFTSQELVGAVQARLQKQEELTSPYRNAMKKAAENMRQMAFMDLLTNLPNRILFWQKAQEWLGQYPDQPVALLLFEIQNLETIAEEMGSSVADLILQSIARTIQSQLGETDILARCQSNCLGLLLTARAESHNHIDAWIEPLLMTLGQSQVMGDHTVTPQIKVGIATYPEVAQDVPGLVAAGEKILRQLHSSNPESAYGFYSPAVDVKLQQMDKLQLSIHEALTNSDFELYYQPLVNTITGRLLGLEALIRWPKPNFSSLRPLDFLKVAQESGQIVSLDRWMLNTALEQIKRWQAAYLTPLKLTVNLSRQQLEEPDFLVWIQEALEIYNVDPTLLTIDVREADFTDNLSEITPILERIHEMGIHLALDDFGTGYSSLNLLKQLPLDFIKVDPVLIHSVLHNPQDEAMVKAIINMAQSLKLKVIAEGVETEEQLSFLRKQGCPIIQGWIYSPPLPAAEIQDLLNEDRRLT